ncbi:uncharacterized protein J3R85_004258 [Psidium guajava]|nr:uncharacterized protein J3R85_004258 [Psidium guajava]
MVLVERKEVEPQGQEGKLDMKGQAVGGVLFQTKPVTTQINRVAVLSPDLIHTMRDSEPSLLFLRKQSSPWKFSPSLVQFPLRTWKKKKKQDRRKFKACPTMKKSGLFAVSAAAASAAVVSSSSLNFSCTSKLQFSKQEHVSSTKQAAASSQNSGSADKFAPRFDGLRFIETLVTAHR